VAAKLIAGSLILYVSVNYTNHGPASPHKNGSKGGRAVTAVGGSPLADQMDTNVLGLDSKLLDGGDDESSASCLACCWSMRSIRSSQFFCSLAFLQLSCSILSHLLPPLVFLASRHGVGPV
jgi:hypothetical protein